MKSLSAGIIGCGRIAKSHMNGYKENNVEITAVFDVNIAAAEEFAGQIGGNVKCYASAEELINNAQVSMVSICTPPSVHENAAVLALAKGIHVLCEKPLAHSVEAARKMVDAAQQSNAILMVAFRHRFLPAICKIKELIDAGTIGDPIFFNNIFCGPAWAMKDKWFTKKAISGGGCLIDTSIHSVDIFRFLFGEVIEQHGVMHRYFPNTDVEDTGLIVLKAANGVLGSLMSSFVAGTGKAFISVMGQKGEIFYDYVNPEKIEIKLKDESASSSIAVKNSTGHQEQIAHFISAISGKERLSCTSHDGLRAVEIIQSLYK